MIELHEAEIKQSLRTVAVVLAVTLILMKIHFMTQIIVINVRYFNENTEEEMRCMRKTTDKKLMMRKLQVVKTIKT